MKCPVCDKKPISLLKFIFKFPSLKIKCQSCGSTLKAGKLIKNIFYSSFLLGVLIAVGVIILEDIYNWTTPISIIFIIVAGIAIGTPLEIIAWTRGVYEKSEK